MPTKSEVLDLLWENPIEIGHWLGFKDLTELNNEWLRSFLFSDEDQTVQAHRGSYKTTTLSLFFALHMLLFPNETVMYFRKTDADVGEIAGQTIKILKSGCFERLGEILYGRRIKVVRAAGNQISLDNSSAVRGSPQLTGLGIGTSITGKHADIVVTDDIVNVKDRASQAERNRTKTAYMELQNIKNRGGRFINTGTPWHKEDAFTLMPNIRKYDCYSTGLITTEELHALRRSMTDSLFAANYELKHIADADALFHEPRYTSDVERIFDGVAHIDAAYGGGDGTALTIIKRTATGYVAYGKLWQKHVDECITEIRMLHERYRAGTISVEDNADKGYLRKELSREGFIVRSYHEHMNKYVKIATYLRAAWDSIEWLDDTDPEYMIQVLDYTENAEHDDAPDSAASIVRQFAQNPTVTPKAKPHYLR